MSTHLHATAVSVVLLLTLAVHVLLVPTPASTDLDVHRNWLAVTWRTPRCHWYHDDTSRWTLDYPPFFAWFQFALAHVAAWMQGDSSPLLMLVDDAHAPAHALVKAWHKGSVLAVDMLLFLAVRRFFRRCLRRDMGVALTVLTCANAALMMVDHVHFQYNALVLACLVYSVSLLVEGSVTQSESKTYLGAGAFACLLHMKHLFVACAPAVLVFLLCDFCVDKKSSFHWRRFVTLAGIVLAVSTASLAPFTVMCGDWQSELLQLQSRLFPFKRGLTHSLWAPNIWALYNALDLVLRRVGIHTDNAVAVGTTRGIVGNTTLSVLPEVSPVMALSLSTLALLPAIVAMLRMRSSLERRSALAPCVAACNLAFFLFGWHVHEKAALVSLLPLALVCVQSQSMARLYYVLFAASFFGMLYIWLSYRSTLCTHVLRVACFL
ncbi:MAG: hypothetical protein MHM6MM_000482 [Cercozoa sp. M6MM]